MGIVSKTTVKSTFETGDTPSQNEFGDFIDSAVFIPSDGAVGFIEVESTASSTNRPVGVLGIQIVGAETTASAIGHLGGEIVGIQVLGAGTTASVQNHIGGGTVGIQVFTATTTASASNPLGITSIAQATQAALEAETDEDTYAPPDLIKHNPGVAKVWVKFDLAGTVNASQNVDSVTDTGTGDWTVNITTDFSDADYAVVPGWRDDDAGGDELVADIGAQAAGSFQVILVDTGGVGNDLIDPAAADDMHAVAFGDQ